MNGAAIEERIWVVHNGATTTTTLRDLYAAYVADRLREYRIYYVDPQSIEDSRKDDMKKPLVGTMSILEVINNGIHQKVVVTSEDDLTVTMGATGMLLDYADWEPTHLTVNFAPNTKHFVSALSGIGGAPGDKIFVRKIKSYRMTGSCNVVTLPSPNMISANGFVVMC